MKTKKEKIKELVIEMLNDSNKSMLSKIDKVLNAGCLDVSEWNEADAPMVLPKSIVAALLERESEQYNGAGTCFERTVWKNKRNIRYYI